VSPHTPQAKQLAAHLMAATVVGGAMSWPEVPTVRVGATPDLVTLGPLGQATVHWGGHSRKSGR
jgi:hypothetical protein